MSNPRVRSSLFVGVALLFLAVAPALADGPYRFNSITPCRIVDTRNPIGPLGGPALVAGTRDFQVQGNCGVPIGAKAAAVNVTVVGPTARGHLRLFPSGTSLPNVATINFQGGEGALGNGAIVSLSTNANDLSVFAFFQAGGASTDFVLDVTGYFAPPPP